MLARLPRSGTRSRVRRHLADGLGSPAGGRFAGRFGLTVDPVDLSQHLRVISRWRKVILASVFLGLILAALLTFKPPTSGKFEWRRPEKWASTSRILVTQSGFPWGRTTLPGSTAAADGADLSDPLTTKKADPNAPDYADPGRLSLLAIIYSFISQSNTIGEIGAAKLPPGGTVSAIPLENQRAGALPLIELTTTGYTQAAANALNVERAHALARYLERQQDVNDVAPGQRVKLAVLNRPEATMTSSHGMVLGVAMLFLVVAAGVAASYMLESLRLSRENADAAAGELVTHPTRGSSLTDAPKRSVR
jgi:hypothetical protein